VRRGCAPSWGSFAHDGAHVSDVVLRVDEFLRGSFDRE
jgi:hypothetical protein